MSKNQNTLMLIGALMFSLSYWPGFSREVSFQSTDLSSNCDLDLQLGSAKEAECFTNTRPEEGQRVNGKILVERRVKEKQRRLSDGPRPEGQGPETEEVLEIQIEAGVPLPGCDNCRALSSSINRTLPLSDARRLNEVVQQQFRDQAREVRARAAAAKARQDRIDRCEIAEDDSALKGSARTDCLINKLTSLEGEKAAEFYDEYLKKDLLELVNSKTPGDRAKAEALLRKLESKGAQLPKYAQESLKDIRAYVNFDRQMKQAILAARTQTNPSQRAQMMYQLNAMNMQAKQYFAERGIIDNQFSSDITGWDYVSTLGQDVTNFQNSLTQLYDSHRAQIGNTGATGTTQQPSLNPSFTGGGRNALGQPSTSYFGGTGTGATGTGVIQPPSNNTVRPGMPPAGAPRAMPQINQRVR